MEDKDPKIPRPCEKWGCKDKENPSVFFFLNDKKKELKGFT